MEKEKEKEQEEKQKVKLGLKWKPQLELRRPFSFASCHFYAHFLRFCYVCYCCWYSCCCLALKMFYVVCDLRNLLCTCFNAGQEGQGLGVFADGLFCYINK